MKKFIKKLIADYKEAQQRPDEWDEMDYYERKNYTRSVLCGFCAKYLSGDIHYHCPRL